MITLSEQVKKAVSTLKKGGIIAYPTETVYGLGCNIFDKKAVKKLIKLKGRDFDKPLSVAVADWQMFEELALLTTKEKKIAQKLLPGPFTFILPKTKKVPDFVTAGSEFVGIRFPADKKVQAIIQEAGFPIITTSANFSSQPSPVKLEKIDSKICLRVDFVVRGKCRYKTPSTIIDLKNRKIIRKGAGFKKVKEIFNNFID